MSQLLEQMRKDKNLSFFGINDLAAYIGKKIDLDSHGNVTLNGIFTPEELEAISDCAFMERATPKMD